MITIFPAITSYLLHTYLITSLCIFRFSLPLPLAETPDSYISLELAGLTDDDPWT